MCQPLKPCELTYFLSVVPWTWNIPSKSMHFRVWSPVGDAIQMGKDFGQWESSWREQGHILEGCIEFCAPHPILATTKWDSWQVTVQRISDRWLLSPEQDTYVVFSRSWGTLQKRGQKNIGVGEWVGVGRHKIVTALYDMAIAATNMLHRRPPRKRQDDRISSASLYPFYSLFIFDNSVPVYMGC